MKYKGFSSVILKSRGLTAWLWLFKNASQAKAATHGLAPAWLGPGHGFYM